MNKTMQEILDAAEPVIALHEGYREHVYDDIYGIPTIGVGFNLNDTDARQLCAGCEADYDRLVGGLDDLTPKQSHYLYAQKAMDVLEFLTQIFPEYPIYVRNRQIALLDMGYNLGEPRFREFKQMIASILRGDWKSASRNALDSIWARQVGTRAVQDAHWLLDG